MLSLATDRAVSANVIGKDQLIKERSVADAPFMIHIP